MPVRRCSPQWSLERRLAERSVRDPKTGCILWTASRNANGYGHVFWKGAPQLAHRAAWFAKHGPIPNGLYVCHRCDVRSCINPEHLFLGTQKDNMTDRALKLGHEPRTEPGPECRPSKAPEIIHIWLRGKEYVTRVLAIRDASRAPSWREGATNAAKGARVETQPQPQVNNMDPAGAPMVALPPASKRRLRVGLLAGGGR
jgi:hypothetical protein